MSQAVRILRLNKAGLPRAWLSREEAATLYVKDQVLWGLGDEQLRIFGGINASGLRSYLDMQPIIACDGETAQQSFTPCLSNALLFRRDGYRCMYCGRDFAGNHLQSIGKSTFGRQLILTRDHVIPRVQGGRDSWTNVVASCSRCNHQKGGRTPEQAGMELLAIPFRPNIFEFMYLANRRIRGDQMDYLKARFSGKRDWEAA
jgi:hypothetical protein